MKALREELKKKYGAIGYVSRFALDLGVSMQSVSNWLNCRNQPSRLSMGPLSTMGVEERFGWRR